MKKKILIVLAILLVVATFIGWKVFGPTVNASEKKYFYVKTGDSYENVKRNLSEEKIIGSEFWFNQIANKLSYPSKVKAGRYEIKNGMSLFNLVRMLRSGNQVPVNFVITKLRTKENLAGKIAANFECDSLSVLSILNNNDSLQKFNLDSNTVMTAIIPNSYSILWNTSASKIFRKLYSDQEKFWNDDRRKKADALHFTTQQVYTLASIVEEETNSDADRGNVASVYINRLRTGQKLEADPTIKFALRNFGLKRIWDSNKQAAANSPYNTYYNKGLPPGPICTPSSKTIDAVLNAPTTDYLFFVAKPDRSGLSTFTHDYEVHKVNARLYQQYLDSRNIK